MPVTFYKMNGSGNDFIIIDNHKQIIDKSSIVPFVKTLCQRKFSVGADGLILIEPSTRADFKWRFYNADGSEAEMCGNGSRCVSRLAYNLNICGDHLRLETRVGIIEAIVKGTRVKISMPDATHIKLDEEIDGIPSLCRINTGVPHVVVNVDDLENTPVVKIGRLIRNHRAFMPQGTNVNFMVTMNNNQAAIRTYERGVEDETYSCGTGSVACALIGAIKHGFQSPVTVHTHGGEKLKIYFNHHDNGISDIFLDGPTQLVYQGTLMDEVNQ
ncbi:MAG: diaminopimelate epimerase [Candidatus Magnetoglobus multicellularis str. Araruama]|uniref:Diaminopimelate epimerase n=1 Tax=Candidatus Magnetoglobus multicellularis str. Araruama TaxID=890399 RepID=A0A1V1P5D9_9BACT|nr:MAG: diaminopimelate epimerase [Candidatus Magnetoglobus multicellularis str. Araruama]